MRMNYLRLVAIAAILLPGHALADELRIATIGAHPPFNMTNSRGELTGFDVELARALCYQMKKPCAIVATAEDSIAQGLSAKEFDAVMATGFNFVDDNQAVEFSDSYYSGYLRFVGKIDDGLEATAEALSGKTLGAEDASDSAGYLAEKFSTLATVQLFASRADALQALQDGKLDAVLTDVHSGYNWLARADSIGYDFIGEAIVTSNKTAIALRKGDIVLKEEFNAALQALLENGIYQRISRNYFPFSVY